MHTQIPVTRGWRSVRVASVAGLALLAGLLSGSGSSAEEGVDPVSLVSACELKDGAIAATVDISVEVPSTGEVGRPVQPGPATVTVILSRADLDGLLPAGTDVVVSRAALKVKIAQDGDSADALWELGAPGTPLPADGEVRFVHSGEVPYVTFRAPGDVDFSAGELTLELRSAAATAEESVPALATLTCRPEEGGNGHLATTRVTPVSGTEEPGTPEASATPEGGSGRAAGDGITVEVPADKAEGTDPCPVEPPVGEMDASDAAQPPPGDPPRVSPMLPGNFGCAYAVGLANVHKLNGAMIINDPSRKPALLSVLAVKQTTTRLRTAPGGAYLRIDSLGSLTLPDAESTFLTFGFQPVSAKVSFENGPITVSTGNIGSPPDRIAFSTVSFRQVLRIHDVKVNGVPLDVGSSCRTSKPFKVVLNGGARYTHVFAGGELDGEVDIPPFAGCGSDGEDLDPLFTASLSGPGNRIFMNQGTTCVPSEPSTPCPPTMPTLPGTKTP
ncbi:DUF6801 domain-containing protein [Streptomyces sp. NPDC058221]|uniref:DUF6801 domain-containing protein n=1 Tax=Streptomyces sp. NPDC058221 TaxID=3346388 RepID=UPI0036E673FE